MKNSGVIPLLLTKAKRFINQFSTGYKDYTEEKKIFENMELDEGGGQLAPPVECQQPIIYGYLGQIAYSAIHERFVV